MDTHPRTGLVFAITIATASFGCGFIGMDSSPAGSLSQAGGSCVPVQTIPYFSKGGLVYLKGDVVGETAEARGVSMLLDSGANSVVVSQSLAQRIGIGVGVNESTSVAFATTRSRVGAIRALALGQQVHSSVLVLVASAELPAGMDMILGEGFLEHYAVTIDFLNKAVRLERDCSATIPLGDPVDYVLVEQNSIGWVVDPATGERQAMRLRATNAGSIAIGDLHFEVRDGANEDDLTLPPLATGDLKRLSPGETKTVLLDLVSRRPRGRVSIEITGGEWLR